MKSAAEDEILNLLFTYPIKNFSYRDIERNTNVSIGTISKYINNLVKKELIKIDKRNNANYVSANIENSKFIDLKKVNNLKKLIQSDLINFLEENLRPDSIILFGSYSKGEDSKDSDIDLVIINGRKILPNLSKFEKYLKRKISLINIKH
jgi:predicted nucleotidyltransferase